MAIQVHRIQAHASRRITHPVFENIDKFWLTVKATDFPSGISTSVNAREPVGLNRSVYKDVRDSLKCASSIPGTFDLMNKGITILASSVKLINKESQIYDIAIDGKTGGIVDGAHTAKIIEQCNADQTTNENQYVEVYVRTGVNGELVTDIARGLNTGMQVAPKSIYNIDGVFDWLKKEIKNEPYSSEIAWRESDDTENDVRDLIGVLELFNIFDFPNDGNKHPIAAYEKWSTPLKKFADDYEAHKKNLSNSKYYKLRPLLKQGLILYDRIRRDFRDFHNDSGGRAGRMNIVEEAKNEKLLNFPFAVLQPSKYRLTKGACYPMLGAFRNLVEVNTKGTAEWRGGFKAVLDFWKEAGPELVQETYSATSEIGRMPDQLGKSRKHWDNLHMKVQLRLLRAQLVAAKSKK